MERNDRGIPTPRETCPEDDNATLSDRPLAYAYVPMQRWRMLYTPENALKRGTLFEELDKPIEVYGHE